jgi:hypothetical protein
MFVTVSHFYLSLIFTVKTKSLPLKWSSVKGCLRLGSSIDANIRLKRKQFTVTNTLAYWSVATKILHTWSRSNKPECLSPVWRQSSLKGSVKSVGKGMNLYLKWSIRKVIQVRAYLKILDKAEIVFTQRNTLAYSSMQVWLKPKHRVVHHRVHAIQALLENIRLGWKVLGRDSICTEKLSSLFVYEGMTKA